MDWSPRGLEAVDVATGDVLWTDWGGAKPYVEQAACADVDGDGLLEIVYVGTAVQNVPAPVNGLDDDDCTVVAVGADGRRRWVRVLSGLVYGWMRVVSLGGRTLVVVAAAGQGDRRSEILVLDGVTGASVATTFLAGLPRGLVGAADRDGVDLYLGAPAWASSGIASTAGN